MWDKWLAALMKAHQRAPYGAAAADWCSGHHRYFKIRVLCSVEQQHNELNCLAKAGCDTGIIFTSLTISAGIALVSVLRLRDAANR